VRNDLNNANSDVNLLPLRPTSSPRRRSGPASRSISRLIILVIAYVLLVPGLTEPMLTVTGTVEKSKLVDLGKQFIEETPVKMGLMGDMARMMLNNIKVSGTVDAFDKTRSILGTVKDLLDSGNKFVAVMIVLFSVIIPVVKGLLTFGSFMPLPARFANIMKWLSGNMSKWSMADVFVIAIFISLLAAKGIREDTGLVSFDAHLGVGFYYFLAYCLLSILSAHILYYRRPEAYQTGNTTAKPARPDKPAAPTNSADTARRTDT